jgi:hypothetical protein
MRDFYEPHFLLLLLKSGNITFEQFITQARDWAEEVLQEQTNRPKR